MWDNVLEFVIKKDCYVAICETIPDKCRMNRSSIAEQITIHIYGHTFLNHKSNLSPGTPNPYLPDVFPKKQNTSHIKLTQTAYENWLFRFATSL